MFNVFRQRPRDEHRNATEAGLIPLLGEPHSVFHEIPVDASPIDVYCWRPTSEREVWTAATSGMSEHAMAMPVGLEALDRVELVMTLPADWPVERISTLTGEGAAEWPFTLLKSTAHLPATLGTWLSYGTTVQAGEDLAETYPGSEFSGSIVGAPVSLDTRGDLLETSAGGYTVHFLGLFPLYGREVELAMNSDPHQVLDTLYGTGIPEGAVPGRPALL